MIVAHMRLILSFVLCALLGGAAQARDLVIFAAASLKEPLDILAARMGETVVSYGGSGTLARQISLGAPADIVMLAHPDWMDVLSGGGHLKDGSRQTLLGNTLVLVASAPDSVALTPQGVSDALGDGRLAIGLTAAVPAGIYGKAALETLGLWQTVADRLAEADNVRAALALVARGEVPLGIVYATDARIVPDLHIVAKFPPDSHPPIRYEVARIATGTHVRAAEFLTLLASPTAQAIFADAGFQPIAGLE